MQAQRLERRIKVLLVFFIIALLLSGLTAFPLKWELTTLNHLAGPHSHSASLRGLESPLSNIFPTLSEWIHRVYTALQETYDKYPFIAYGTDWLAFAHIVIAIAFWGPLKDPVRNLWVVEWGMIACVLVVPLAMICGPLRGIPFYWRLFDCAFGVFGIIPLWLVRRDILRLVALRGNSYNQEVQGT